MHSLTLPRNSATFHERRRHVRHNLKPSTTVVVELGPNNGGNLINIGGGGLSLQAVSRLIPEAELTLRFRLPGIAQPIATLGHVTWVGPTQKVAGISFKNLPETTEQQIVEWVASHERSAQNDPSTHADDPPLPPSPISPDPIKETKPDALPPPSLLISLHEVNPQRKIILPLNKSLESFAQRSEPHLDTISLSKTAANLSSRRSVSLDLSLISRPAEITSWSDRSQESRRRRWKIAIAVVVTALGILAMFLVMSPDARLIDRAKAFLGMNAPAKMDPAKAAVPVWAVPASGVFYCADSPNFKQLQPGTIMTQGEAIQGAYKPNQGYCQ